MNTRIRKYKRINISLDEKLYNEAKMIAYAMDKNFSEYLAYILVDKNDYFKRNANKYFKKNPKYIQPIRVGRRITKEEFNLILEKGSIQK